MKITKYENYRNVSGTKLKELRKEAKLSQTEFRFCMIILL